MELPCEFLKEMKRIVPDYEAFLRSYDRAPSRGFFVNRNKTDEEKLLAAMSNESGMQYLPISYAEGGYYIGEEKWGNHRFHRAGLMYFQEPSAMMPVDAFDIDAVLALDLCAAPGGKTIRLANRVKYLVSNEINPSRAAVLKSNVERMGLKNVAVINYSPAELEKTGEVFDLILVDAPCSGEGMFRKDEQAVMEWSLEHSVSCARRQSAILESADKLLKKGGMLIYSTCTFSERENEGVITAFLDSHDYDLIMPKESVLSLTAYLSDKRMRRFYPHMGEGEGQFFCALIKNCGGAKTPRPCKTCVDAEVSDILKSIIGRDLVYARSGDIFFVPALPYELGFKNVVSGGVRIGVKGKVFKPDHYLFSAYGKEMYGVELDAELCRKYLHGEELEGEHVGYLAATVLGAPLGGMKGSGGRYKNLYPKGLRI